jgi:hypothetical protein
MARVFHCDICKKQTDSIVAKMFFAETGKAPIRSKNAKSIHNNYTKHLDVGVCCVDRVITAFNWSDRMTADEYNRTRAKNKGGRKAPVAKAVEVK